MTVPATHYRSASKGRVLIETMQYNHCVNALKALENDVGREDERDAISERIAMLETASEDPQEPTNFMARVPNGSPIAPPSEASAIINVIERAALNPNVDIDKLERLLSMQERIMERQAKVAYTNALRTVKRLLPVIEANGRIEIKDRNGRTIQSTPYGLYEDIDAVLTPILDDHGLVLSFRTSTAPDGRLVVTGVLSHVEGHEDTTTLTLPFDSSGSKNGVQAVGSSLSYGQRYAAKALLNFVCKGEDDDGETGGKLPSAYLAKQGPAGERCNVLRNEIPDLEDVQTALAWGQANAAEITAFPAGWQKMIREDLAAHIAMLRAQEGSQ